jgi:gamma-glutamylcyclotransferase (GGCT)/AIG2-like uncharacterized protein YtfP
METCMHDLIFVYGSLLSSMAHPKGEQLRREADLVGSGRVNGRLYRVSWYPGVVLSHQPDDNVHGEVYGLRAPAETITWLDAYEGLTPEPAAVADRDEYARVQCSVSLANGTTVQAWIYVYQRPTTTLLRVPSGRWSG